MNFRPTLRPAVWSNHHDPSPPQVEHVVTQQQRQQQHQHHLQLPSQQKPPLYRPSTSFSHSENDAMRTSYSFLPTQSSYCPPQLTPSERLWRDRANLLYQKGYQLRHRYQPDWSSRSESRKQTSTGEDHIMQILPQVLDGRRREDGRVVCIKMIQNSKKAKEIHLLQYFSSRKHANDPRNHVVPYYDSFQDPLSPTLHYIVMPILRRFDDPEFTTGNEVADFVTQAVEGLAYLHENNVAHHNLTADQIMMDAQSLIPGGWHFVAHFCQPDGFTRITSYQRKTHPVRYYFVGFGSSYHFPPGQRPLVSDIGCTDTDVPELSGPDAKPYDPFKLDVYTLGNVFLKCLYMKYHGLHFLGSLIDYMRNYDFHARPSAALVLQAWTQIRDSIPPQQLESRIRTRTYEEMELVTARHADTPPANLLTPPGSDNVQPIQVDEEINEPEPMQMDIVEPDMIVVDTTPETASAGPSSSGSESPVAPPTTPPEVIPTPPRPPPPSQPQPRTRSRPQSHPARVVVPTEFTPPVSNLVPGGRSRRTTRGKGYMTGTLDLRLNTKQLNSTRTAQHRIEQQQTYMQSMTLNMELRESSTIGIISDNPPLDNVVVMHYPNNGQPATLATTTRSKQHTSAMSLGGGPAAFLSPLTPGDTPPPRFGIASSVGVHPYPLSAYAGTQYYGGTIQATHGHSSPQQQSYFDTSVRVAPAPSSGGGSPSDGSSSSGISVVTPAPTAAQNRSNKVNIVVRSQESRKRQTGATEPRGKTPTTTGASQTHATSSYSTRSSSRPQQSIASHRISTRLSAASAQQRPQLEHRTSGASDNSTGDSPKSAGSARSDKRDIASILNV